MFGRIYIFQTVILWYLLIEYQGLYQKLRGTRVSAGASVVRTADQNNTADLGRGCCFVGALSPPV